MDEQKYTFFDFINNVEMRFREYIDGEPTGEYPQGVFDNFLRAIAGDNPDIEPDIEPNSPSVPQTVNIDFGNSQRREVVCTVLNHDLTFSDFVVINTTLNILMLLASFVILKRK